MFFFLPLGTTRPHSRFPTITYGLMGLNVLVFVVQLALGPGMAGGFVPAQPSFTSWLLALFMHGGLLHLAGNLLFLWLFGTLAEDVLGPKLFLAFYFGGAVAATALDWAMSAVVSPASLHVPRVGASGAIAGIMGLSVVCFLRTRVRIWYAMGWVLYWRVGITEITAPTFLGLWVGLELVQGLFGAYLGEIGGIAHWAHVGGFFGCMGAALAMGLNQRIAREDLITGGRTGVDESVSLWTEAGELEQFVLRSPEDAEAWRALGLACEGIGRAARARECYHKAVLLFLRQCRPREAAQAYEALSTCPDAPLIPTDLFFDLASGLEETGKYGEAYRMFRSFAAHHPDTPKAETALGRAGQIAFAHLQAPAQAGECYRTLLEGYPSGQWRALAQERLEDLRHAQPQADAAPEPAAAQHPAQPTGALQTPKPL